MKRALAAVLLGAVACAAASSPVSEPAVPVVPASRRGPAEPIDVVALGQAQRHFHTLPVRVNGRVVTVAILDTGIGLALVSRALCERIACREQGTFAGKRMSGQEVRFPLTTLEQLEIGTITEHDVVAGVIDIPGFFPEPQIEVFVGLPFFAQRPFTIDPVQGTITFESEDSLAQREHTGRSVAVRLDRQGPALDIFAPIALGEGAARAEMLMDTGSPGITLHPRYAEALGVDLSGPAIRRREGTDETGQTYVRFFTTLEPPLAFAEAADLPRPALPAMFQDIIHDGLVGVAFLSSFVITYDLPRARVIVADAVRTAR
jgi:predicted aspartyl protease